MTKTVKIVSIGIAIIAVSGLLLSHVVGDTSNQVARADISTSSSAAASSSADTQLPSVRVLTADDDADSSITTSGQVQSAMSATISSQTSGVLESVPVVIGQQVSRGETLAAFANQSQQASVRQARANLQSSRANLAELKSGARPEEVANAELSVESAETNLAEARQQFFNTDLQAYLADGDQAVRSGDLSSPTISGTYTGDERGSYRIELYPSDTKSGYSFRYTGLENGIGTVSTDTPQPLGKRGLYIQFPDDFAKSRLLRWTVPIPNTRSQQFVSAQSRYQQAQTRLEEAKNNSNLTKSGPRSEQIDAAQSQVRAAQASLEQAQAQLDKTTVQAPFAGTVLSVPVDPGAYVGVGQPIAKLVNRSELEVQAYLAPENVNSISVGDPVRINSEGSGRVTAIAPAVDTDTGSIEVRVAANADTASDLIPGTYADLRFQSGAASSSLSQLPLSAVKTSAGGSFVLAVSSSNILKQVPIEVGDVSDSIIRVRSDLPEQPIVRDASGLSAGQEVTISGENQKRNGQ